MAKYLNNNHKAFLSRYYKIGLRGAQTIYRNIKTGDTVQDMHIYASFANKFKKAGEDFIDFNEGVRLIKHHHFQTLIEKPLYRVGKPPVVDIEFQNYPNIWKKPEHKVVAENAEPFIQLLHDAIESDEVVEYLLDVLAWRTQNPNKAKPHIAFFFYHREGGHGKTTFAETMKGAAGETAVKILNTTKTLSSMNFFEAWNTSWLFIEEADVKRGSKDYDILKSYTGSGYVDSDAKNVGFDKREIPAMLFMLSNREPTFIEEFDRRFCVSEWYLRDIDKEDRKAYFKRYRDWLDAGGFGAVYELLMNRKVPETLPEPPMTIEKQKAMQNSVRPVVTAIKDALDDNPNKWLFTVDAFDDLFDKHRINSDQRRHLLCEAGLERDARRLVGDKRYHLYKRDDVFINKAQAGNLAARNGEQQRLRDVTALTHFELK